MRKKCSESCLKISRVTSFLSSSFYIPIKNKNKYIGVEVKLHSKQDVGYSAFTLEGCSLLSLLHYGILNIFAGSNTLLTNLVVKTPTFRAL